MPPGYNNPDHLKGRKKKGSGWFITINSQSTFNELGEEGVQRFKKAIQDLFAIPENLAKIIDFKAIRGVEREEHTMDKLEAVEKYLQLPVAMEGIIERSGKNVGTLIHAHIIVGIYHYSIIHLNSKAAQAYFRPIMGKTVRFQLGGDEGTPRGYRNFPSPEEINKAMHYAGKDLRMDGDYFSGTKSFSKAEFEANYGTLDDYPFDDEENEE